MSLFVILFSVSEYSEKYSASEYSEKYSASEYSEKYSASEYSEKYSASEYSEKYSASDLSKRKLLAASKVTDSKGLHRENNDPVFKFKIENFF